MSDLSAILTRVADRIDHSLDRADSHETMSAEWAAGVVVRALREVAEELVRDAAKQAQEPTA